MNKNFSLTVLFAISFLYAGIALAAVIRPSVQVKNGPDLFTQKLSINEENGLTLMVVNYGDLPVTIDKAKIYNDLQENNQNYKNQLIGTAKISDGIVLAGATKTIKITNLPKMPTGRKYYQIRLYSTDKKVSVSNMVLSMVAILSFDSNGGAQTKIQNIPATQTKIVTNYSTISTNSINLQKQTEEKCGTLLLELNNIYLPSLERRHQKLIDEASKGLWTDCSWLAELKSYQIQEYNSYIIQFNKLQQSICNFDGVKETSKAKALMDQECVTYQQAKCQTPMTCN